MKISTAMDADTRVCQLADSAGHISTEFVYLYPPGIPLLVPGERITQKLLELFQDYLEQGLALQGLSDYTNKTIHVVEWTAGEKKQV